MERNDETNNNNSNNNNNDNNNNNKTKNNNNTKQLLDEVFVISGIIKVEVSVISRRLRCFPELTVGF